MAVETRECPKCHQQMELRVPWKGSQFNHGQTPVSGWFWHQEPSGCSITNIPNDAKLTEINKGFTKRPSGTIHVGSKAKFIQSSTPAKNPQVSAE